MFYSSTVLKTELMDFGWRLGTYYFTVIFSEQFICGQSDRKFFITRSLTLTTALNVTASPVLKLSFWYKHTIDTLDNAYVDISNDNGSTWKSAKFYNKTVSSWTREVLDISALANSTTNLKIRFSMISNGSVVADGIYIDNIKLTGYDGAPTSIAGINEIPEKYSLSQNYPNPFNPSTVISYNLAEGNFITLKIYNELGKEVSTLVNERQNAGSYSIHFDGSNLPGFYYYKLESGGFVDTKKMLLISKQIVMIMSNE